MGNRAWKIFTAHLLVALFLSASTGPLTAWAGDRYGDRHCDRGRHASLRCERQKPTLTLTANPAAIERGATSTLSWSSENADLCFAGGKWAGRKGSSGEKIVAPKRTAVYKLTCFGKGGKASASVKITVEKPAAAAPAADMCPNLDGVQTEAPTGYHLENGECVENVPEPTDLCPNLDGIQETVPIDHHIEDGACIPDEDTDPLPGLGHIVISEVYYDVDAAHGVENNGATGNEWVELRNPTNSPIDIAGWSITDATASDMFSTDMPLIIPPQGFAIISPAASTTNVWSMPPGTLIVALQSAIGNGLANGGDALTLKNGDSAIDAMSYGSNTSVFELPVPTPSDGHSFSRIDPDTDSDSAADWQDSASPSPGE